MRATFVFVALFASFTRSANLSPDLVAPIFVDLIGPVGDRFDLIKITSFIGNIGEVETAPKIFDAVILSVGIDSFHIADHSIPKNVVLDPGKFVGFEDTAVAIRGAFSINTQCDPLNALGERGGYTLNNVRSQAFNFHPEIKTEKVLVIDTLYLRDTVKATDTKIVHDTLRVVQKDTVKITARDTIRITVVDSVVTRCDTVYVDISPPKGEGQVTSARVQGGGGAALIPTTVYNAIGQPVWKGSLAVGEYPRVKLKAGLHLLVQGAKAQRFRVAYR